MFTVEIYFFKSGMCPDVSQGTSLHEIMAVWQLLPCCQFDVMRRGGSLWYVRIKVTLAQISSLALKCHQASHCWSLLRFCCRLVEAVLGSLWEASTTLLLVNVVMVYAGSLGQQWLINTELDQGSYLVVCPIKYCINWIVHVIIGQSNVFHKVMISEVQNITKVACFATYIKVLYATPYQMLISTNAVEQ